MSRNERDANSRSCINTGEHADPARRGRSRSREAADRAVNRERAARSGSGRRDYLQRKVTSNNRIWLHAVGGLAEERMRRSLLAGDIFPDLRDRSSAVPVDPRQDSFPIPPSIAPCFVALGAQCAPPAADIVTRSGDTVLIIGHTSFSPAVASDMLRGIIGGSAVFVQGPGFNIGQPALDDLKARIPRCHTIAAADCPSYSCDVWREYIRLYPPAVAEIHQYGLAGFFLSRFDGAFYRQFGLVSFVNKKRIEVAVAERLCTHIMGCGEGRLAQQTTSMLPLCANILDRLTSMPDSNFIFAEGKHGGSEDCWKAVYKLWASLDVDRFPFVAPMLSEILLCTLQELSPELRVKEYDGFAAHCMLRSVSDTRLPSEEEHKCLVEAALCNDINTVDEYLYCLASNLRFLLETGDVHVVHDIGLDPMVDDYLAIQILCFLQRLNTAKHGVKVCS